MYLPICKKYTHAPLVISSIVSLGFLAESCYAGNLSGALSSTLACIGIASAGLIEKRTSRFIARRSYGLTEGGKFLRRVQFLCAGLGVCSAIALQIATATIPAARPQALVIKVSSSGRETDSKTELQRPKHVAVQTLMFVA